MRGEAWVLERSAAGLDQLSHVHGLARRPFWGSKRVARVARRLSNPVHVCGARAEGAGLGKSFWETPDPYPKPCPYTPPQAGIGIIQTDTI